MTEVREPRIETIICNEDLWYLRLGYRLGVYRRDLTHSTVNTTVLAVPRKEVEYWRARLADLQAGHLEDGAVKALFIHESVHSRQMSGWPFWLWGMRYILSRRFRRRMEEEAYTVHLTYLAECGVPIEAPYWVEHLQDLYFGAFNEKRAKEAFARMVEAVRGKVPHAKILDTVEGADGVPASLPWLKDLGEGVEPGNNFEK
ncbi:MAG: hypothetical protein ACYTHM_21825 [Planctomycetota bacterium]|jgi:hypothetical protein